MSTLHLFEPETEAQEETRPLSSRKRVAAAIAAVCLVASGGYVAARHSARNNDAVMTPHAQAAPSVTEQQATPASQPDVAAPSAAPAVPESPRHRRRVPRQSVRSHRRLLRRSRQARAERRPQRWHSRRRRLPHQRQLRSSHRHQHLNRRQLRPFRHRSSRRLLRQSRRRLNQRRCPHLNRQLRLRRRHPNPRRHRNQPHQRRQLRSKHRRRRARTSDGAFGVHHQTGERRTRTALRVLSPSDSTEGGHPRFEGSTRDARASAKFPGPICSSRG